MEQVSKINRLNI